MFLLAFVLAPAVTSLGRFKLGRIGSVLIAVAMVFAVRDGLDGGATLVEVAEKLTDHRENIRAPCFLCPK